MSMSLEDGVRFLRQVLDGSVSGRVSEWPQFRPAIETVLRHVHVGTDGDPQRVTTVPCDCGCGRSCCADCGNDLGFTVKIPSDVMQGIADPFQALQQTQTILRRTQDVMAGAPFTGITIDDLIADYQSDPIMALALAAARDRFRQQRQAKVVQLSTRQTGAARAAATLADAMANFEAGRAMGTHRHGFDAGLEVGATQHGPAPMDDDEPKGAA